MMLLFQRTYLCILLLLLWGCGAGPDKVERNDAFSSSAVKQDASCLQIPPTVPSATVSGVIEYERVPVKVNFVQDGLVQSQLSPNDISKEPAKGITVQALSCVGEVVAESSTDNQGRYQLSLSNVAQVRIRSLAVLNKQGGNTSWSVTVRDNTRAGNPIYAELTELFTLDQATLTRNLLMSAGWGGVSFDQRRQSAPFAIVSTLQSAMNKLIEEGVLLKYPPLTVYWSAKNRSVNKTDLRRGELITSFYQNSAIYLLGHIPTDSDDMDEHVIVHEWGHFLEDHFSRSDSIGGAHSLRSRLDARVSFSEGFGNAISALLMGDSKYRDALGSQAEFLGGGFDVEADEIKSAAAIAGWYSEHRAQAFLYDLYDAKTENEDEEVELPIETLFAILGNEHKNTPAFTTMVSFLDALWRNLPDQQEAITPLLTTHKLEPVESPWGEKVTLGNFVSDTQAKLFQPILEGKTPVCLNSEVQTYNGVATRRFYRFKKERAGQAIIEIEGPEGSSPSFRVWKAGNLVTEALSRTKIVNKIFNIDQGEFIIEATDLRVLNAQVFTASDCYQLSLTLN